MAYLFFTVYFLLLLLWLINNQFILASRLNRLSISGLFALKISAGIAIGWLSMRWYPQGNDYWTLQRESLAETELLRTMPGKFLKDILQSNYGEHYGSIFDSVGSYWNDLKNNLIIKVLAILNLFSRGNYYINSLFFNTAGFLGAIALYRAGCSWFGNRKAVLIAVFFIPSTLYFSSGIHKDLVVFTALGFLFFGLATFAEREKKVRAWLLILGSLFVLFIMRNFVVFALFFPVLLYLLQRKTKLSFQKAAFICIFGWLLCTSVLYYTPYNPLHLLAEKQKDFLALDSAFSQLSVYRLTGTVGNFISATPGAINHAFFRPYLWEYPSHPLMLLAFELFFYYSIIVYTLGSKKMVYNAESIMFILLAVTMFIIAGYIVPNCGSLVRYRSLYLPFLVMPFLVRIIKNQAGNNR